MGLRKRFAPALALIAVGLVAMVAAGCGGGGSESSSGSTTSNSDKTDAQSNTPSSNAASEDSSSEPSREFLGNGPNGKLAKIGKEASAEERETASRVLEKSLDARAAGDWTTQCSTLAASAVKQLEQAVAVLGSPPGCAQSLEVEAGPIPAPARANTMTGPIDAFRINQGFNGFAFYHGTKGRDFVIPLIKQGGEWKVVALQEEEIR